MAGPRGESGETGDTGETVAIMTMSGSLRAGSVNTAVLRTARALAPEWVRFDPFDGIRDLPFFDPDADVDPLHPAVADLRRRITVSDAVLFSTPEYAGALPGGFKNALDWMVGGTEIAGKLVGWLNPSTGPVGGADAYASLRKVFAFIQPEIVEDACVRVPVLRRQIGPDGLVTGPAARGLIALGVRRLAEAARSRRSGTSSANLGEPR